MRISREFQGMVDCCPLVSWLGYELAGGDSALKTQKGGKISPAARL